MLEKILARRSVRKYNDTPITEEQIERIMRAAMSTPSACDCRPWEFVLVKSKEGKEALAKTNKYTTMAAGADLVIVVCALPEKQEICPGFFPQDCGALCQSILLQASAEGLGAVWCGIYPTEESMTHVAKVIKTPESVIPFALICMGNTDTMPEARDRYEADRVHGEVFNLGKK